MRHRVKMDFLKLRGRCVKRGSMGGHASAAVNRHIILFQVSSFHTANIRGFCGL